MSIVNRNEFASIVGKSAKWVGEWIKEGMPTEGGGGRGKPVMIDTMKAIDWMISREVKRQVGDDDMGPPKAGTRDGEELLTSIAKRRKAEVEADKAEELVIGLDEVGQFMFSIGTIFGRELNGLGARLAPEVLGINEPAKCKNKIDVECRRIRIATADRLREFVSEYRRKYGRNGGLTADKECGGVGDK